MLESYLQNRLRQKDILLMTHIVLGYPSFEESYRIIKEMVGAGVDLMELQIPFSEPTADGPVIAQANQKALQQGVRVEECLGFADKITRAFDIPFLIMSYYNIPFKYGIKKFASTLKNYGLKGAIIPDLPPEEGQDYLEAMGENDLDPILIFSPTTSLERMKYLASFARGFVYCVARKGVTGENTDFTEELALYLSRCRESSGLPLAVGFGIKDRADIEFLKGKADIAVIGSQTLRIVDGEGIDAVGDFIRSL